MTAEPNRARHILALLTAAAVCACSAQKASKQPEAAAPTPAPTPAATAPSTAATTVATGDTTKPSEPAPPATAPSRRLQLENRIDVVLLPQAKEPSQSAEVALLLPGGTETGREGSAELAAHLLAHGADATSGRQSLDRQVAQMGGTLDIEIGRKSTWVHLRMPSARWQLAAQTLVAALETQLSGRGLLERSQEEHIAFANAAIARDPVLFAAERMLLGDESPAAHLQRLLDRDAGEAVAFQRRYYRPDRSLLVVRAPIADAAMEAGVRATFGQWQPGSPTAEGEITTQVRKSPEGIAWIEDPKRAADAPCEVAIILQWPDPHSLEAPALHVLASCITVDGVGGRLERLQQDAGLSKVALTADTLRVGEGSALVLRGSMSAQQALQLHATMLSARKSLRDIPISTSERTQARAAAWLSMRACETHSSSALRDEAERVILGKELATQIRQLADLDRPGSPDSKAIDAFLALPVAMVVHGGSAPAGAPGVRNCPLSPSTAAVPLAQKDDENLRQAALPWRNRVVEAMGGAVALQECVGFESLKSIATKDAPTADEATSWRIGGNVRRTRKVLGATVETLLAGNEWTETVAGRSAQLSPQEAAWRRNEVARHPLALVLAWQRGDVQFRVVTTRRVGDRDYEALEAIDGGFERLRIEIDRESGLLRTVECWATTPDGNATRSVDTWNDYRSVEGVRVPFRCSTIVDDGQSERTTTFVRVQLLRG